MMGGKGWEIMHYTIEISTFHGDKEKQIHYFSTGFWQFLSVLQLLLRAGNVFQAIYLILYPLWCLKHKIPFSLQVTTQI